MTAPPWVSGDAPDIVGTDLSRIWVDNFRTKTITVIIDMASRLMFDHDALAGFCRQNHIRRLALFGSRLKGSARPDSDVDLLVEFEQGHTPGLLGISALEIELSGMMGHKVDLRTAAELSRHFRDEVIRSAEIQYAG